MSLQDRAIAALEEGKILHFPHLAFAVNGIDLLSATLSDGKAKNISLSPGSARLKGVARLDSDRLERLHALMERFAKTAATFVHALLPHYSGAITSARTSFRPVEIDGRRYSPRKDDKLLHVDAFPSQPTGGRRILRLFTNINPQGRTRLWSVGEPFEDFATRFLPKAARPILIPPSLLGMLGITKGHRSPYDTLMLRLHDSVKADTIYQRTGPRDLVAFQPGSSWLVYTDQTLHAVRSGQHALEQTFHLDVAAMADPERSTLRILERMTGKRLDI